jgi:VWFA-related protein
LWRTELRLAAVSLAAASVLSAQEQPPAAPVFPSAADVVTIDVVVTDEKGEPVAGLNRDDFVIREDGQAQGLTLFEALTRSVEPPPSVEMARTAVSDNRAPARDRPLLLVAFDEPHLTPSGVERARMQIGKLPGHPELRGTDVVLVSTAGGGSWLARLPEGGADLTSALTRFRGLRPMIPSGRMKDYEAFQIAVRRNEQVLTEVFRRYLDFRMLPDITPPVQNMRGYQSDSSAQKPAAARDSLLAEAEQRWQDIRKRQAATVAGLTRVLASLDPRGRKAVLLITEGFIQESAVPDYADLAEAARRAHAALHVVDPRDDGRLFADEGDNSSSVDSRDHTWLMARELKTAEGADALALATGGRVLRHLPGLPAEVERLGSELRTYYLLGYEPKVGADGRFHKLAVEVNRPGLRVSSRPGYFALKVSAPPSTSAALPQVALESAADSLALPTRLSGYVLGPTRKGKSRVRLVAELDGAPFASAGAPVDVVFQLAARERPGAQQWATELKAPAPGKSVRLEAEFEADPGVYQARVMARERAAPQRMGSVRHTLEVRPLEEFRTSTPVLTDIADGNVPVPRADRRFRREAKLFCLIEVLGASGRDTVTAGMDLRQPQGPVLLHIPPSALTSAQLSRLWAIPLRDLVPGAYELTISVQETGSSREVRLHEAFEVVAN